MHLPAVIAFFGLLTMLVGCGEDVAKSKGGRKTAKPGVSRPPSTAESLLIQSQLPRARGIPSLTYTAEIEQTLASTLPATYRPVPDMEIDDEGVSGKNVITIQSLGRPGVACGTGAIFAGIAARMEDCKAKNGDKANWSGELYGIAGEGNWRLVALTGTGKEFWTDLRTGMVWSDVVAGTNWCKASGNTQVSSTTASVNCAAISEDQSLCSGANIEGFGANIKWRLPTRGDYLQADLDGMRFVMQSRSNIGAWTSTIQASATGRDHAWVYHLTDGTLSAEELSSDRHVRCIGTATL